MARNHLLFQALLVPCAFLLGALIAPLPAASAPRDDLAARGLEYTSEVFVERAGAGDLEAVKLVLAAGMDGNVRTDGVHWRTPFVAAVSGGHLDIVSYLARNGAAIDYRNDQDDTPLMVAAIYGQTEIVRWLVAKGAEVNAKGAYEQTPLIYAATFGSADTVRILLEHGAEMNARDYMLGLSALDRANDPEIIRMLREAGGKKASELR